MPVQTIRPGMLSRSRSVHPSDSPPASSRWTHALDSLADHEEDFKMNPEDRLSEILTELERAGWAQSEGHPMGTNTFIQMVNLFFGVFSGNGVGRIFSYVQEAPNLTTSGLGMDSMISYMALYYTFFGIYAAEKSAVRTTLVEYETLGHTFHVVSRILYVFLTTQCLLGVVCCLHFMMICGSMPLVRRRNYLIGNGRLLSLPYSVGPLSFAFIGIAFFAERAAEVFRSDSKASFAEDIILSTTICLSFILYLLGTYFGTVTIRDSMRPWPEALAQLATEATSEMKKNARRRRKSDPNLQGAALGPLWANVGLPNSGEGGGTNLS